MKYKANRLNVLYIVFIIFANSLYLMNLKFHFSNSIIEVYIIDRKIKHKLLARSPQDK